MAALFRFARGPGALSLHAASVIGLAATLFVAAFHGGAAHDLAVTLAAFFAVSLCIGAIVATSAAASPSAETMLAATARTYPGIGPTFHEKSTPRHSPFVGISAQDDKATEARLVAVSFWGDVPLHMRYWRLQPDGSYRWVESRSEPLREPGGTRRWSSVTADIDDQRPAQAPPTKIASNPSSDDSAVWAAKMVENLLGNAWAFDAAGRPTYLTPLGQTLVAVTLEEFQAVVDEGHTFFKRTAHPDDYDRISAAWRRSLQTGDPFFLDRRIRRASGIHEWNRTGFVPTRDRQGRITGWYGSMIDLDSHRIAEAELRDRERELSQLVDMVPSHIWRLTPDGEPIFFNKRMADFVGLGIADMDKPGLSRLEAMIETVHPDDAVEFRDALRRCLATGESFSMRYRLRRADGVHRWMSSHAEPMRDQDGGIVQWYGTCVDIDDQVRLYRDIEEREAKIRRLVDSDIIGIVIWDLDGTLIDANDAFLRIVQYERADLRAGLRWFDMTPPEWQEVHAREEAEELARTGKMQAREKEYFRKDGSRVPVLIGAACFEGQSTQGVAYVLDLTERKRAEAALRDRERELSQLINMGPILLWRTNAEGEATFFNKPLIDFLGLDVADTDKPGMSRLAASVQTLVHPDDAERVLEESKHSLATGGNFYSKYRLRRADGVYRWMEGRVGPIRDEDGRIIQWYGVLSDIDEEIHAQEALRQAHAKLARAAQAAGLAELSASIAHEVNQPLAAIVANSHACHRWLSAVPPNVERAKITAERIIRDANSAADVVSHIRALFRQSVEPRSRTPLSGAIAEARSLMAEEAIRRRIRMDIDVEGDLPLVAFDRVQIQQVLINLIRNGFDAMDSTPDDRVLGIRVRRHGDLIQTEISDRGAGVEFPDKIFEAFFTTKENGMGMGLAICRSIIESHGGRLWAEENEPHGARFIFTLPQEVKTAQ
ncbi:PAS domain-containing protein [Bradyrhizobium sp. Arg68]|uniref:PAS domain-containing sensor histidine kinase n=1 Tax=Bradyrhizobium ivorense TaxID=2511166 RepID=UPI001E498A44|nr:PAS domain-containing protein [Bradyrhizobium ivorense]MCC8938988.1 PAS domain-containing protein [Bradyrhizobium ivorense]